MQELQKQNRLLKIILGIVCLVAVFLLGMHFSSHPLANNNPLQDTRINASTYKHRINYKRPIIIKNIVTRDLNPGSNSTMTGIENHKVALYLHHIKNIQDYNIKTVSSSVSDSGGGYDRLLNTIVLIHK